MLPVRRVRGTGVCISITLRKINDIFYDQIRIADQKAAYIFTFTLAFLVSSAEGRSVFKLQRYISGDAPAMVLSAILAVAVVVSLISAILVVVPRHRADGALRLLGGMASNIGTHSSPRGRRETMTGCSRSISATSTISRPSTAPNIVSSASRSVA